MSRKGELGISSRPGMAISVRVSKAIHEKVRHQSTDLTQTIQDWVLDAIKQRLERDEKEDGK